MSRPPAGGRESGRSAWLRRLRIAIRNDHDRAFLVEWRVALKALRLVCPDAGHPLCLKAVTELNEGVGQLAGRSWLPLAGPISAPAASSETTPWQPRWQTTEDSCFTTIDPDTRGLVLEAASPRGLLYAVFALLEAFSLRRLPDSLVGSSQPSNKLRMLDHWDNADGSIERGYAGKSIFFKKGRLVRSRADLERIDDYARLLASVGINAVAINNVNVHHAETRLIEQPQINDVARIATVFRAWGIRLFLSVNYASPLSLGGLKTADPLDPAVIAFWAGRAKDLWTAIPDFGGFVVKADSEGRPGPFTYGRTHAEGANLLGRAVAPFGGLILWRCFVYNCQQDWRDRSTDRARAAYDHFLPLDGQFLDNVVLQIKNGPLDFQVREPVSPLLGALRKTNQVLELQITQEYTGQQRHLCCLLPQWEQILRFDSLPGSSVARVASGLEFQRPLGGVCGVANVGDAPHWTGHPLAQVNLYGFGALAWNPERSASDIIADWVGLTFDNNPTVLAVLPNLLKGSWEAYESYTAPLGVGWMVNPDHHYGPNVDGYEFSRWGTYHFADRDGIGVARSKANGTGYAGQYQPHWAQVYETVESCPDELLLFFHHVPWTHCLHDGRTVIQSIYDSHFEGVQWCDAAFEAWKSLESWVDATRFAEVSRRLEHQCLHSREWRDQINTYCLRKSGVPDQQGRTIYP